MKKQIIFIMVAISLIAVAWGAGAITRTDATIRDLSTEQISAIKTASGQAKLNPEASTIICDGETCKSNINLPNVIQTEWIGKQYYCYDNKCLARIDYTPKELELARNSFVSARLKEYADNLISQRKIQTEVVGGGTLTYEGK
jgi:negative regulator of genetic competence, sporulation and motility